MVSSRWTSRSSPDFPLPAYKALSVKRPVKTIADADIDIQLKSVPRRVRPDRPQVRGRRRGRRPTSWPTSTFHKGGVELQRRPRRSSSGSSPSFGSRMAGSRISMKALERGQAGRRSARPTPRSDRLLADPALRGQSIQRDLHGPRPEDACACPTVERRVLPVESVGFDADRGSSRGPQARCSSVGSISRARQTDPQERSSRSSSTRPHSTSPPTSSPARRRSTLRRQVAEMRQAAACPTPRSGPERPKLRANAHESDA